MERTVIPVWLNSPILQMEEKIVIEGNIYLKQEKQFQEKSHKFESNLPQIVAHIL